MVLRENKAAAKPRPNIKLIPLLPFTWQTPIEPLSIADRTYILNKYKGLEDIYKFLTYIIKVSE